RARGHPLFDRDVLHLLAGPVGVYEGHTDPVLEVAVQQPLASEYGKRAAREARKIEVGLERAGVVVEHDPSSPNGLRSSTEGWRPMRNGLSGASTISVRRTSAPSPTRWVRQVESSPESHSCSKRAHVAQSGIAQIT